MTFDAPAPPTFKREGLRAVALVALASLACTTVRVPASGIEPSVRIRGDVAEPQVELWIESRAHVSPAEAAQATAEARAALAQALSGRQLGEGDQLLVVRAQGVTRTGSRRADQTAAIAGIAIAAVAIVAVVVVAIVATQGKAGGGKAPAVRAAPAAVGRSAAPAAAVRATPVSLPLPTSVPRVAPPPRPPTSVRTVAPARRAPAVSGHSRGSVAIDVGLQVDAGPVPQDVSPAEAWLDAEALAPPPPPPLALDGDAEVVLAPPAPLELARRGFFAKDLTRLELTLVDRASGAPLWVKTVEKGVDPRDARAVRRLLDAALDDAAGWHRAPAPVAVQ